MQAREWVGALKREKRRSAFAPLQTLKNYVQTSEMEMLRKALGYRENHPYGSDWSDMHAFKTIT